MTTLQAGQKSKLNDLGLSSPLTITVEHGMSGLDVSAFGLNAQHKLLADDYMVFYNNPRTPGGEVSISTQGGAATFRIDLSKVTTLQRVMLCATHDTLPLSQAPKLLVTVSSAAATPVNFPVTFDAKAILGQEKAVMLLEVYQHAGEWRIGAVGQGFNGGLGELVQHFGGEVASSPAPAAPTAAPPATAAQPAGSTLNLTKERQRLILEKAERQQPQLLSLIKAASISLEKRGLSEARYRVNLVLDISGSMSNDYANGAVQRLAERALALAARLDDDGEVEVYLFGARAQRKGLLSLDNVSGFIERMNIQLEGSTYYSGVMQYVREDARNAGGPYPTLVLFITDGDAADRDEVVRQMREASHEPIFWKFMGISRAAPSGFFGKLLGSLSSGFDFLEKLDDLQGRRVDNANFFSVSGAVSLPDSQLFDLLTEELDSWQREARAAGILRL